MTRRTVVRLGVLSLLWGSSFLLIRLALDGMGPIQVVLARMVIGALVLTGIVAASRLAVPRQPRLWLHLTFAAVVANIIPYFLFAWAEQTVPSNVAGVLNATTPLFTLAVGVLARQERRVTAARAVGLALGFAGALLVLTPWRGGDELGSIAGQLACLGAAASYGVAYVYMSRFLVRDGVPAIVLSACQLSVAAVLLLLAAPFVATGQVRLTGTVVLSVLALGALGTGIAYVINYQLISDEGPTTASIVTYLIPVVAVVLGVLVLGEPVTWNLFAGTALVLAGVAVSGGRLQPFTRARRRRRAGAIR